MRFVVLCLVALCALGCVQTDRNTWRPAPADNASSALHAPGQVAASPSQRWNIVFPPVAAGPLAQAWHEAPIELAYRLAGRVDSRGSKARADGWAGPHLPAADDPAWRSWPVPGTSGADFLALMHVTALERQRDPFTAGGSGLSVHAEVELRAFDSHGNLRFARRSPGSWRGVPSPKFPGPPASPEAAAVSAAAVDAVDAFLAFLEQRNEVEPAPHPTARLVSVTIDSNPPGADVLIDGVLRGTTPCTVHMPVQRVHLRLERTGYRSWERVLLPEDGMRLQPVLERK